MKARIIPRQAGRLTTKKIVFVGRVSGKHQIFIISPDGSALTQLTDKWNNEDPSFSPDGRFIIFFSDRNGGSGIYIMRANGESQKENNPTVVTGLWPKVVAELNKLSVTVNSVVEN